MLITFIKSAPTVLAGRKGLRQARQAEAQSRLPRCQREKGEEEVLQKVSGQKAQTVETMRPENMYVRRVTPICSSVFSFEIQFPRPGGYESCLDHKLKGSSDTDGEYEILLAGANVTIYCSRMETAAPKEYITLPKGGEENYSEIYGLRCATFNVASIEKIGLISCTDLQVTRAEPVSLQRQPERRLRLRARRNQTTGPHSVREDQSQRHFAESQQ